MTSGRNWSGYIQSPVRVIAGDTWLAGNVSLHTSSQPLIFIDAERKRSPWVTESMLDSCDVLVLVDRTPGAVEASVETLALMKVAAVSGSISLPWTSKVNGPKLTVDWGIVPADHPGCVE